MPAAARLPCVCAAAGKPAAPGKAAPAAKPASPAAAGGAAPAAVVKSSAPPSLWASLGTLPGEQPRSAGGKPGGSSRPSQRVRRGVFDLENEDEAQPSGAPPDASSLGWEVVQTREDGFDDGAPQRSLPAEMRCFDRAKIFVKAGDGGDGATAFRREACVPQGGPAGGNGGDGGNVYVVGDAAMTSLLPFRKQVHFRAGRGGNGEGKNCFGRSGQDVTVHVPLGTVIKDAETGQTLAEVLTADQPRLVLKGGRGGRGNASFKSNRVRAPLMSEKGESALETWLLLELQVVADVGIVGMPNAGKSTLLASLSAARPKVASYAFTTLVPNLGVCEQEYSTTVFADIPGLVEGAHLGIGLGHQFLRHVMRCRVLVHLLDGAQAGEPLAGEAPAPAGDADPAAPVRERGADAIIGAYHAIQTELAAFSSDLATKPQVVVLNKLDLPACRRALPAVTAYFAQRGQPLHIVSAATGEGVTDMVRAVRALLADLPAAPLPGLLSREEAARPVAADLVASREGDISDFRVFRDEDDGAFVVESAALARFVQMTNWEFFESVQRFSYVLKRIGVWSALKAAGCKDGDTVVVGNMELEWQGQDDPGQLYDNWRRSGLGGTTRGARHWPHAGA